MKISLKVICSLCIFLALCLSLTAQEYPVLQVLSGNQVGVETAAIITGFAVIDPYDFPFRSDVSFTIHYDPALLELDVTQGPAESPGVTPARTLTINTIDASVPGKLMLDVTLVNHIELLTVAWKMTGSGVNTFTIEPGPDNLYFNTKDSRLVILPQVPGDVDNNRELNIVDALQIARASVDGNAAGLSSAGADVDGNGMIDIVDALRVAQYCVGLISSFPVGTPELQQVLFLNLEKKAGALDAYAFTELGEAALTPPGEVITENRFFIVPQNTEVYLSHQLRLSGIEDNTLTVNFEWINNGFTWSAKDRATGRLLMDEDKDLTAYYSTAAM